METISGGYYQFSGEWITICIELKDVITQVTFVILCFKQNAVDDLLTLVFES